MLEARLARFYEAQPAFSGLCSSFSGLLASAFGLVGCVGEFIDFGGFHFCVDRSTVFSRELDITNNFAVKIKALPRSP